MSEKTQNYILWSVGENKVKEDKVLLASGSEVAIFIPSVNPKKVDSTDMLFQVNTNDTLTSGDKLLVDTYVISQDMNTVAVESNMFYEDRGSIRGTTLGTQGVIHRVLNTSQYDIILKATSELAVELPTYYEHYRGLHTYPVKRKDTTIALTSSCEVNTLGLLSSSEVIQYNGVDCSKRGNTLKVEPAGAVILYGKGIQAPDDKYIAKKFTISGDNLDYVYCTIVEHMEDIDKELEDLDDMQFIEGHFKVDATGYYEHYREPTPYTKQTAELDCANVYTWAIMFKNESGNEGLTIEVEGVLEKAGYTSQEETELMLACEDYLDDSYTSGSKRLEKLEKARAGVSRVLKQHILRGVASFPSDTVCKDFKDKSYSLDKLPSLLTAYNLDDSEWVKRVPRTIYTDQYFNKGYDIGIEMLEEGVLTLLLGGSMRGNVVVKKNNILYVHEVDLMSSKQQYAYHKWATVYAIEITNAGVRTYTDVKKAIQDYNHNRHRDIFYGMERASMNSAIWVL